MANINLEKKVVGALLDKPNLAKRNKLEAKWFNDEKFRQTANVLLTSEKEFLDLSEVEHEISSYYPKTTVTEDWLQALKFEAMYVQDFKGSLQTLEAEYIKDKAHEASLTYAEYPNEKNRQALEKWLRAMNELQVDEDEGLLDKPTDQLLYELENEVEGGLKSYKSIDDILGAGIEGGMLFVIGARPGVGKTAFMINLAAEILLKQDGVLADAFTLEMTQIIMLKRFISHLTGINSYKFKNASIALKQEEKKQVVSAANWLNSTGLRIHDKRFKLSDIERVIRQRVYENPDKPYIAFVDYLGLVDSEDSYAKRNEQIGRITRRLKILTNELNIPIVLLSQLSRAVESRDSKVPTLSDLRESGDIEQDANVIGFLSQDEEAEQVVNLTIAKNREGRIGTIPFNFIKSKMKFEESY